MQLDQNATQVSNEVEPDGNYHEHDGCPKEGAVLKRFWRSHQPDPVVCDFYGVKTYPELTEALAKHVAQLQDNAQRNVKPWEDTFPPTLLPAYVERLEVADTELRERIADTEPHDQSVPYEISGNKDVRDAYALGYETGYEHAKDEAEKRDLLLADIETFLTKSSLGAGAQALIQRLRMLKVASEPAPVVETAPTTAPAVAVCPSNHTNNGAATWRADNTCSWCGSLHPDMFMAVIQDGTASLVPTDKNHKVYARIDNKDRKFYFAHLSEEQQAEFIRLLNKQSFKIEYPGRFYVPPFFCKFIKDI